jgi:hypothetical protein
VEVVTIGFLGVAVGVAHGGMEGAWLGVVEVVVCTASIDSYVVTRCQLCGWSMEEE